MLVSEFMTGIVDDGEPGFCSRHDQKSSRFVSIELLAVIVTVDVIKSVL